LTGWVRNRMDGSVEAMVQGEPATVAQFEALAMHGPTAARVTRIDAHDAAAEPLDGFEQHPTA
ncbi:acylphosphatase, partial [Sphingobium sp.]|uniref:acylphosphatase n=1 Tax=Sphingobium sp. TaxID=1912891 RepID=UPI003B3A3141